MPTKQGLIFALLLFLMLTGSINYGLGLGFALTFILSGLYLVSIYHAFSNLAGLRLETGKVSPVFAGEAALFRVNSFGGERSRRGIGFLAGERETMIDLEKSAVAEFSFRTKRRGWFSPGRFTVFTLHPLGLFKAWSYVELDMHALVYPKPFPDFPLSAGGDSEGGNVAARGQDDFSGLREYRHGDSLKHVAWKRFAIDEGLQVKEFEEMRGKATIWLDYEGVSGNLEERLSKLTAMALEASRMGARFGLRLPGKTIQPEKGEQQKLRILEALALFQS